MLVVKPISDQKIWDGFLTVAKPDTFLQSWQWGEFNARIKATPTRLGVYRDNELVAIALTLTVRARRGTFLLCPHGPILKNESDANEIMTALTEALKKLAKEQQCIFIRIAPLLSKNEQNENMFSRLGYRNAPVHMVHPELAWILDVTPDEETLLKGMRKSTRYSIKKAEKDGVTISISTDILDFEKFWNVYSQTVKRQHFTAFTKDFLKAEFEIFARENNAAFFFAHYKGEITATAFIVFDNLCPAVDAASNRFDSDSVADRSQANSAIPVGSGEFVRQDSGQKAGQSGEVGTRRQGSGYYHHGATTQKYPGLTDAQLLQWAVIKECKRRNLSSYNFWGVVPEDGKKHPWSGLSVFKRGFGGYEKAYVHAKDLPLSGRYWVTYAIEKVRRWKRRL